MKWTLGLALVVLVLFTAGTSAAPFCTPKAGTPTKAVPNIDVPAFTTEYRAIIKDKKYTQWAKESYDSVNNKARVDVLDRGLESTLLIDYNMNAYVQIEYFNKEKTNVSCVIQALDQVTDDDNLDMFGFNTTSSSGPTTSHVVSSSQVLQLAKMTGVEYIGQTDIDGLAVDHFQSCLAWDDVKATFLLDYYFTTEDFLPRDKLTPKQIPVRAAVKGQIEKTGNPVSFEHVYEYLDFRVFPFLPNETFGLPEFLQCVETADVWQRPFPDLPTAMSYTVETVKESKNGDVDVQLAHVHLSTDWRIIRVDQGRTSSICDFSTGVEYVIDDIGCNARPISPVNVAWALDSNGVIKMKDRPEVFYLKQKYFYAGMSKFRELSSYSYAAFVDDESIQAYVAIDDDTPLGLHVVNSVDSTSTYYNIFNFDSTSSRTLEHPFDIQRCVDSSEIKDFTIKLETSYFSGYFENKEAAIVLNVVQTALRNKAAEAVNVSPLQFIGKDISVEDDELYWVGGVLGLDSLSERAKVENQLDLKSVREIETSILNSFYDGKFTFDIPYNSRYLSKIPLVGLSFLYSWNDYILTVSSDTKYNFELVFAKCVKEFQDKAQKTIKHNLHECAQACTDSMHVSCTVFEYVEKTKTCQLSWASEAPELVDGKDCVVYRRKHILDFTPYDGVLLMKDDEVNYKRANDAEECAKLCVEETGFHCESFDYCTSEKRCQINKSHYFDGEKNPEPGDKVVQDCKHYSRYYDDYNTYYNKDFEAPEYLSVKAETFGHCQFLCSKDEDGCMAFTFCYPDYSKDETEGTCKILASSQAKNMKIKSTDGGCTFAIAPGVQNTKAGEKPPSLGAKSEDAQYNTGAMLGLALAMLVAGAGVTGLTVFLLRYFKIWEGF